MSVIDNRIAALLQAGLLDPQTANMIRLAMHDNPEARPGEQALRQLEQRISATMQAHLRDLAERIAEQPSLFDDPATWQSEERELYELLAPELGAAADLGETSLTLQLGKLGADILAFSWGQTNESAAQWAERYTYDLVRQLTATTREQLQRALAAFHATPGMTRGQLERLILQGPAGITDLETARGLIPAARRAENIAVTEVTRSFTEGELSAMRASGLPSVQPTQKPPAHVGCRCDLSPFPRENGVMSWRWQTLNDDRVCDRCAPLHGQDVGEA